MRILQDMAESKRRELGYDREEYEAAERKRLQAIEQAAKRIGVAARVHTDEEILAYREEAERRRESAEKQRQWELLIQDAGKRYAGCRLDNFTISTDPAIATKQGIAIEALTKLVAHLDEHIESGGNVILYGPPGTGKDHLLFGLLREAVRRSVRVTWCNGQDLYGSFRDNIDSDDTEARLIRRYCESPVLAISDPVPPKGDVSNFAASMLYRIVDGRYRRRLGSWFTVNVATADEGSQLLSGPVFDRMRDNAVAVFCNWPSYRQTNKPKWM